MIVRAIPTVDDLVTEHFKLVALVVRSMRSMPCVKRLGDEALAVGWFALFKAARGYDLSKGASFKTYAETAIRNDVTKEAIKNDKALGLKLIYPDAIAGRESGEPIELPKKKRRRRRRLYNPIDGWN